MPRRGWRRLRPPKTPEDQWSDVRAAFQGTSSSYHKAVAALRAFMPVGEQATVTELQERLFRSYEVARVAVTVAMYECERNNLMKRVGHRQVGKRRYIIWERVA